MILVYLPYWSRYVYKFPWLYDLKIPWKINLNTLLLFSLYFTFFSYGQRYSLLIVLTAYLLLKAVILSQNVSELRHSKKPISNLISFLHNSTARYHQGNDLLPRKRIGYFIIWIGLQCLVSVQNNIFHLMISWHTKWAITFTTSQRGS